MSSAAAEGLPTGGPPPAGLLEVMNVHASTAAPAERILRDLGMPPEEIRTVLVTDDPRLVRRHLELHRERLVEELLDRRRVLAALERELADAAVERSRVVGDRIGCARSAG